MSRSTVAVVRTRRRVRSTDRFRVDRWANGPHSGPYGTTELRSDDFHLEFLRGRLPGIGCPRHINAILTEGSILGSCNLELNVRFVTRFDHDVGRVDADALGRFDLQSHAALEILATLNRDRNSL